jgi:chorismate mutase
MRKGVIKGGFEREPWFPSLEARCIRKNLRVLRVQNLGLSNSIEKIIDITLTVEKDKARNNRANKNNDSVTHKYLERFLLFF